MTWSWGDPWGDVWAVRPESDRQQWDYVPGDHVGPLRFGMTHAEAVTAMADYIAHPDQSNPHFSVTKAAFREPAAPPWQAAVTTYFREGDGMYCLAVDALRGPQVTMDGIQLVGRVPSELNGQIEKHAESRGFETVILPSWDFGADEFGFFTKVQRAGDVLLTRPVFAIVHSFANTLSDAIPAEEMCPVY